MDYLEALRLLRRRGDWERSGSAADASRWDLRRMRSLLSRIGDPHLGRGTVHVAGSKGKGSVAAMIAAVLRAANVSAGLYTKPHLHRFVERIAVDGEAIAPEDFGRLMAELSTQIEAEETGARYGTVSTFEALVALAFLYFREREAAWQVLEVGLGGRLDATNVFDEKAVCVITPIGLEHTAILGDTVGQIAEEKAAIITPGATVVMGPQREAAAGVVRRVCAEREATLIEVAQSCAMKRTGGNREGQDLVLRTDRATYKLRLPLLGRHQLSNAATAVLSLEALAAHGVEIDEAAMRRGLAALRWPGRIELLRQRPLVIADGAHSRDSARALVQTVREELGCSEMTLVVGCSSDKDIEALAGELAPLASQVIATRSRHPRAMDPRDIADVFAARELPATVCEPVGAAVDAALAQGDAVLVCGSLFVAAEAREHVLGVAYDPPVTEIAPEKNEVNV
ncbi:MAG: bifunctional folylpolyglutamate synthase/dihydrofolate synthase [Chloroflexi bacterium]|nr:bifunctional folylpolyglutamate synthase/dihydrofolate synthase [Chloroflexota bacterium]